MKRYKEADPRDSVARAQEILRGVGLDMQPVLMDHGASIFSARLSDAATGFGTNGKGASADLCLASAYGEAMERLQNGYAFDAACEARTESHGGFAIAPDEAAGTLTFDDVLRELPFFSQDLRLSFEDAVAHAPSDGEAALAYWRARMQGVFALVPYFRPRDGQLVYLPDQLIGSLCGSNGLCAGNTGPEALCEGMSELCERYAKHRIFTDRLCPPTVERSFIDKHCPEVAQMMDELTAAWPQLRLRVFDANLGQGLPVVGVLSVDTAHGAYRVKFGSHPSFAVALERCLTEFFQGMDASNEGALDFYFTSFDAQSRKSLGMPEVWPDMMTMDVGPVHTGLFGGTPDWEFSPWGVDDGLSNEEALAQLTGVLTRVGGDVYVRDMGYLGFPAYRVYVPGVSCASLVHGPTMDKATRLQGALGRAVCHAVFALERGDVAGAAACLRQTGTQRYLASAQELELREEGMATSQRDELLTAVFGEAAASFAARWRTVDVGASLMDAHEAARAAFSSKRREQARKSREDANDRLRCTLKDRMAQRFPDQARLVELPWG